MSSLVAFANFAALKDSPRRIYLHFPPPCSLGHQRSVDLRIPSAIRMVSIRLRRGLWGEGFKRDRDAVILSYWWD